MRFISLFTVLVRKGFLEKINNLPKSHGAGPNAAASAWGRPWDQSWRISDAVSVPAVALPTKF